MRPGVNRQDMKNAVTRFEEAVQHHVVAMQEHLRMPDDEGVTRRFELSRNEVNSKREVVYNLSGVTKHARS